MRGLGEFGFQVFAGTAGAVQALVGILAVGIAALDHEVGNHAMEQGLVIKTLFRQLDEILDVVGRDLGKELEGDIAVAGGNDGLGHASAPISVWIIVYFL